MKTEILQKSKHIILSSILCITVAFTATAQSYTLTDDDVLVENGVIVYCSYLPIKDIIIPETLDGQTVTGIGNVDNMPFARKDITSVCIPATVECIGAWAFCDNSLTTLDLSGCTSLTNIGELAFCDNSLTTLDLSGCTSLTSIGDDAFRLNSLTSLDLNNCTSLTNIGGLAFCHNLLTTLDLSGCTSLTSIGYDAFRDNSLTTLDLSGCTSLTSIGNQAFKDNSLTSLDLSNCTSLTSIGDKAFIVNSLTSLDLNNCISLTSIGSNAFRYNSLASLNLSSCISLTSIGDEAFKDISLTLLDLSNCTSLTSIGDEAFRSNSLTSLDLSNCTNLRNIGDEAFRGNPLLTSLDLSNCTSLTSIGNSAFKYNSLTSLNLSSCKSLTNIGDYAFSGNSLTTLDLSGCTSLTSIGNEAFKDNSLTSLDLSNCTNLTSIGDKAFISNSLTSLDLNNCISLTSIGSNAFRYNSLASLNLSSCTSLTSIGDFALTNNPLNSFTLPVNSLFADFGWRDTDGNTYSGGDVVSKLYLRYYISVPYILTDEDVEVENGVIVSCTYNFTNKRIIIPETLDGQTVTGIGNDYYIPFARKDITTVRIPATVECIGAYAFCENSITSLDLSHCTVLTNIEEYAFGGNSMESLDLSGCKALISIGKSAFSTNKLTTLNLSGCSALTNIGEKAFNSNNLTRLNISGCYALTDIGSFAFERNSIRSLDLSGCSALTSIGRYAFSKNSLAILDLSNCIALTNIDSYAFMNNSLYMLNLNDCISLTDIGMKAFYDNNFHSFILPENHEHGYYYWKDTEENTYAFGDRVYNFETSYSLKEYYVVKFYDWDETELKSDTLMSGSTAIPPADPVREGYTFTGWDTTFTNITESYDVTAEYEINTYEITFKDWDDLVMKTDTVEYESDATPPADPVRESYTFTGWDTTFTNITESYDVNAEYEISTYVVTFFDWDNTELKTETIESGSNATAPVDPIREGYTFIGWDTTFTNITESYDITAEYEIKSSVTKTVISVLKLYPNPTKGMLYVSGKAGWQIQLFTLSGQRLQQIVMNNKNTQLNLSEYPEGTYILKVGNESGQVVRKVVKK